MALWSAAREMCSRGRFLYMSAVYCPMSNGFVTLFLYGRKELRAYKHATIGVGIDGSTGDMRRRDKMFLDSGWGLNRTSKKGLGTWTDRQMDGWDSP